MTTVDKEDIFDSVKSELINMHVITSTDHVVQPTEDPADDPTTESDEQDENESGSSSRPAKRARKSDDKEARFSKLLGDIFNIQSNDLPPRG